MSENKEQVVGVVKCYELGKHGSTMVAIPKWIKTKLAIEKGQRFVVKLDEKGRLIYERIEG